ncbi:hypothetical protein Zm00014a_039231 [Zea mays]|uniref:Uncharacterized protein n=2 Tax=Zea mays TaxID=4577 RepID=A0A3L6F6F7_MAIZE|nr:hypothetical protein ZEAMMB73_Zm00001d052320 [Zea mays]PWZ28496.1 hypothetical protein Zm00014a_039231 [Zea mays]PWZ28497.1 hypothetical protein Zm00014a_039231 [Zea mays]PWZ28498.1 hypothetical protein Zm00014a_039231 [Zea mays]PWZ28499.1 hypothetical protein Zm00014a_039231 [Zea mays]
MAVPRPQIRALRRGTLLLFLVPLIYSVSRLQPWAPEKGVCLPPPTAPKRPDHLVLGPAAGQDRPDRLQCRGTEDCFENAATVTNAIVAVECFVLRSAFCLSQIRLRALNKIGISSEENYSGEHVSFATVFTTYNSVSAGDDNVPSDSVTVGNSSYSKIERSMAILNTFISFIKVSMPRSDLIILTDPGSKISVNQGTATLLPVEGNYSRGNLMLQRIKTYIAFLEQKLVEFDRMERLNHFVLTDSDIAVVGDLGHIFKKYPHFHLAVTFRNNKGQPLNSGFVAVRGTRDGITNAVEFLKQVLGTYSLRYMKASRMLGDQLALAWVVKSHLPSAFGKFSKNEAFTGEVNGTSVLFLPCAVYNWTPPEGAGQFHGVPLDVKVVHFKGSRKRLMLEAWNFYSSTSKLSDMLCLILRSGRTKYDF